MMKRFDALRMITLLFVSAAFAASAQAAASGNLIVGADAEAGKCTGDWNAVTTVPGWTVVRGNPSVVCYSIASF